VSTALSSLGAQDMLTILDDSLATFCSANAGLLHMTPNVSPPTRVHLTMSCAQEVIVGSPSILALGWLSKTASRDIAPLRNISLLLSAAVPAETTILIDDDIHSFDLVATHHRISALDRTRHGVIVGADICGIDERDSVTRLTGAIDILEKLPLGAKAEFDKDLFYVPVSPYSGIERASRYVSGGYLAFRLPFERLFAFPPGYNEDWLWCLLHGRDVEVQILLSGEAVIHDPPSVLIPNREDFFFELVGDIVFKCLEELHGGMNLDPEAILTDLSRQIPIAATVPADRALMVLEKAQTLSQNGGHLSALGEYGLTILADMLRAGELNIDRSRVLIDWCDDAVAKQKSFAATLHNQNTISTLRAVLQEKRI